MGEIEKRIFEKWYEETYKLVYEKCQNCVGFDDCDHIVLYDDPETRKIYEATAPSELMNCCNYIGKDESDLSFLFLH